MSPILLLTVALGSDAADPAPEDNTEAVPVVDVPKEAVAQIYSTLPVNCDKNQAQERGIVALRLDDNTVLMEVVCGFYAYNAATLYYTQSGNQEPKQLQFSLPTFRFHLERRGDVEHTIIDSVDEMRPTDVLYNTHYEPKTKTLSSYNKHRGVGDAFTEASWRWESDAGFQLVHYAVDHSLDGKLTASTVYPQSPVSSEPTPP